jgi:NAD(P)-dependent dehydrogenase (short-subunit alcohol dehydrogenase family)
MGFNTLNGTRLESPIEESPLEEIRRQFEVNVFGAVAMVQAGLPFMRKRRTGQNHQYHLNGWTGNIPWRRDL